MKNVKIIRVAKGNEEAGAQAIADYYNQQNEAGARPSRAIITVAGEDMVYTIFSDTPNPKAVVDDEDEDEVDDDYCDSDCDDDEDEDDEDDIFS